MITDEERREISGNLRYCAEMCNNAGVGVLDSDVLNALDIHCGDTDGVSSAYDVEKLADLIDRPTCHIIETDHEFEDSVRCDMCRTTFNRPWEPFKYCPNCGAEVIND